MTFVLRLAGLLVALALSLVLLLQIPAVQDRLMQREIARRASSIPTHLFTDDALRAVLCGSAAPMPVADRAAACVMVIADGRFYVVDTGNRSANNLALWRIPAERIGGVLLTHFHSDHIGDLGEFNMMSWAQGRPQPLTVYGPPGVAEVVEGFRRAYALDSQYRTAHHGAQYLDPARGQMLAREVALQGDSATVLDDGALKITMFRVEHAPIEPAVGYRFDYRGRSVVISGDTIRSEAMVAFAKDADLLFHEALARPIVKQMERHFDSTGNAQLRKIMFDIQDYHSSPIEAAEIANAAGVRQLVLYHLVPPPPNRIAEQVFLRGVGAVRPEGVAIGYDGLTVTLPIGSQAVTLHDIGSRH